MAPYVPQAAPPGPQPTPNSNASTYGLLFLFLTFLLTNVDTKAIIGRFFATVVKKLSSAEPTKHTNICSFHHNNSPRVTAPTSSSRKRRTPVGDPPSVDSTKFSPPIAPLHTNRDVTDIKEHTALLRAQVARMPHPLDSLHTVAEAQADTLFFKAIYYADSANYEAVYKAFERSRNQYRNLLH